VVLRFAGIYGPGRLLREKAVRAGEPLVGDAEKWLNLIHVADGARAVLLAEDRGISGQTYLIADDRPARRREVYTELARVLNAPPARFDPPASPAPPEPNRRIANRKAKAELGFAPQYPSFVEGLAASLP
jgi:nucleoside-diphosphate-sugar epimerase